MTLQLTETGKIKGMKIRSFPRSWDDDVLTMLAMKRAGATWGQIGKTLGRTAMVCRLACVNVVEADIAESGEPEGRVRGGYW